MDSDNPNPKIKAAVEDVHVVGLDVEKTATALVFKRPDGLADDAWDGLQDTIRESVRMGVSLMVLKEITRRAFGAESPSPDSPVHDCAVHPEGQCTRVGVPPRRNGETVN